MNQIHFSNFNRVLNLYRSCVTQFPGLVFFLFAQRDFHKKYRCFLVWKSTNSIHLTQIVIFYSNKIRRVAVCWGMLKFGLFLRSACITAYKFEHYNPNQEALSNNHINNVAVKNDPDMKECSQCSYRISKVSSFFFVCNLLGVFDFFKRGFVLIFVFVDSES